MSKPLNQHAESLTDAPDSPPSADQDLLAGLRIRNETDLLRELTHLFNRESVDADLGIHDFLLAEFVVSQLQDLKLLMFSLAKMKGNVAPEGDK